jgi:hypothetical protein
MHLYWKNEEEFSQKIQYINNFSIKRATGVAEAVAARAAIEVTITRVATRAAPRVEEVTAVA